MAGSKGGAKAVARSGTRAGGDTKPSPLGMKLARASIDWHLKNDSRFDGDFDKAALARELGLKLDRLLPATAGQPAGQPVA